MKKLLLSMLGLAAIGATAQTQVSDNDLTNAYTSRAYNKRVTCHDPSIVVDDITNPNSPTYYIYGSHLGRGKTLLPKTTRNGPHSRLARKLPAM